MDSNTRKLMINRLRESGYSIASDATDQTVESWFRSAFGSDALKELAGNGSAGMQLIVNDDADMLRLCTEVQTLVRGADAKAMAALGAEVLSSIKKTLSAALSINGNDEFTGYSLNSHFDDVKKPLPTARAGNSTDEFAGYSLNQHLDRDASQLVA